MPDTPAGFNTQQTDAVPCCKQRVLLLTQDRALGDILNYALDAHNFEMVFPVSDTDVLSLSASTAVDYIIMDQNRSVIRGAELIKKIRSQYPSAFIIVLHEEDRGVEFLHAGATDFLQKPFIPYRLVMMLDGGDIQT